ncbi:MAG: HD domain-containing protein [Armatimonadetes bacterium]|nr:HD domain-containing protein [Armatimonadota bacterium]
MGTGKTILLVDQDPLQRRLASTTLRSRYEVVEASGGDEGLRLARELHPDLILLDCQGWSVEGRELCRQFKNQPETAAVPILLLGEPPAGVEGTEGEISTPFYPSELLSRVGEHLADGSEMDAALLQQLDREQLMAYARDLSRSYRQDARKSQELNSANRRLRELERMKDVFLSIVSHELRTPLTVIKGHLHLLRRLLGKKEAESTIQECLGDAQQASLRLEQLVEELLNFSGIKSGVSDFKPTRLSIARMLSNIRGEMEPLARRRDCDLDFRLPSDPLMVEADPRRLREAISHVVRNAILFNRPLGTVSVEAARKDSGVTIRIRDTGCGIPSEDQARVFDPFYQTGNPLTRGSEGLGLGLSVARHIVEAHGGKLELASRLGEGTTVTLGLPLELAQTKAAPERELEAPPPTAEAGDGNELVRYAQELHAAFESERVRRKHLEELNRELERTFIETLATLVSMVDLRGSHATSHVDRVSYYARAIARRLDPELPQRRDFVYSLLLYDVGKIGVAEALLQKVEQLSEEELRMVRAHTEIGANLLSSIRYLEPAIAGVRNHHERWDGTGYPDGLSGQDIPLVARIIAVADAFDAMTVDRPYRKALGALEAREEIVRNSGTHFDPQIVQALLESWDEITVFRSSLGE